jgi:hypothetical protein
VKVSQMQSSVTSRIGDFPCMRARVPIIFQANI